MNEELQELVIAAPKDRDGAETTYFDPDREWTIPPRPDQVGVFAVVQRDGHRYVIVRPVKDSARFLDACRTLATSGRRAVDWQAAVYDDASAARAGLMRDFGPGWFSRARAELDAIA